MFIIACLLFASFFLYCRFFKERSVASWLIERYFWMSDIKRKARNEAAAGEDIFWKKQEKREIEIPKVLKNSDVREYRVEEMQVLTWNQQATSSTVLLYLHGGSYRSQAVSYHFSFVDKLSKDLHAQIVFPIYPLIPQANYRDVYPLLEKLYQDLVSKHSADNIVLMGDSAGGGLALGFSMYLRDKQFPQPKHLILFSPWLDVTMSHEDYKEYDVKDPMLSAENLRICGRFWAGTEKNLHHPYVSPLYGKWDDLPPILMFTGTHEIFYPDIMRVDNDLTQASHPHQTIVAEKMNHVYAIYPIPESSQVRKKIVEILR